MEFVIISGMSGGGKSKAATFMEDMGFFCVDNLPAPLIPKFAELGMAGSGAVIPALMTGSVGAYAFCGMALVAGFITLRIAERRRKS